MCFKFYSNNLDRTLFYSNMTVSLCIRQGSNRNDDSVSVEELDWSAERHVPINRVIATTVCVWGKKREHNRPLLLSGVHFTPDCQRAKK